MSDSRHGVSACESVSNNVTMILCNIRASQFFGPRSPRLRGNHPVSQVVTSTPSRSMCPWDIIVDVAYGYWTAS